MIFDHRTTLILENILFMGIILVFLLISSHALFVFSVTYLFVLA